ncbi:possible secreted protease [Oceanicola granulosus HTCC2516]|uniref:Possible secreted protease n=1 Tax=Oceanicola granulosus (strain ATCC BAA-861 / DSM 15982 / KCTC 12143 / HTCC2516) TaxID=314256 RepID=Q2CB85_OCEGH|nr:M10 family metallopeptidase C-terminal domain-containing protein [Oceanicola granulosus]EAR49954.1 possible secreted protease [Oceanicola granulosus HTCC2516]
MADDYASDLTTSGRVGVGGSTGGNIEERGDLDLFAVDLVAGQAYTIEVGPGAPGEVLPDPFIRSDNPQYLTSSILGLFTADETQLVMDASGGELLPVASSPLTQMSEVGYVPTVSGTYYILVGGSTTTVNESGIGSYTVSVATPVADDFSDTIATTGSIAVGGESGGVIQVAHDRDWFAVKLEAGKNYELQVDSIHRAADHPDYDTEFGNLRFPVTALYDAAGNRLAQESYWNGPAFDSSRLGFTPEATGTYYFEVATDRPLWAVLEGYPKGQYTVSLSDPIADDFAGDATTVGTLSEAETATGTIDFVGDTDWLAVELEAGQGYLFSMFAPHDGLISGISSPRLELFGPDGTSIVSEFGLEGEAQLGFVAETGGVYFIEASARGPYKGAFEVDVFSVEDDYTADAATTGEVLLDEPTFGSIELSRDVDWLAMELDAGVLYSLMIPGEAESGMMATLIGPDGVRRPLNYSTDIVYDTIYLADVETNAPYIEFEVQQSGTYFLEAEAFGAFTGDYDVVLTELAESPATDGVLAAFDRGGAVPSQTIRYHLVDASDEFYNPYYFEAYATLGFTDYQVDLIEGLFSSIETVADLRFEPVDDLRAADLLMVRNADVDAGSEQTETVFQPLAEGRGLIMDRGDFQPSAEDPWMEPGAWGHVDLLVSILTGLRLDHPHENNILQGLEPGPFGYYDELGDADLAQGIYTAMSLNRGLQSYPDATLGSDLPSYSYYGYEAGPMALDIAALQHKYGANTTARLEDDVYVLPDQNAVGTTWTSIWDAGGIDAIAYEGASDAVVDLRAATLDYEHGGGGYLSAVEGIAGGYTIAAGTIIENASLGSGDDRVTGNAADNIFSGGDGDDSLRGELGNDTIDGGAGDDVLDGGDGDDVLSGGDGEDVLTGGLGSDTLEGGAGDDSLFGGLGEDRLDGGDGIDSLVGGAGRDILAGGADADSLTGGLDDDLLDGGGGDDTLNGGSGRDSLSGGDGDDVLDGGAEDDVLSGGEGEDVLTGGLGSDALEGGAGADNLFGGLGEDSLDGGDGIDTLVGGAGRDILAGGADADDLRGGDDDDLLDGGDGDDLVSGGTGADSLTGGLGRDSLAGGIGDDRLSGGDEDDVLEGGVGDDVLAGGTGADILDGGAGRDRLAGGAGDDRLSGGAAADRLSGGAGGDSLFGGSGTDRLDGGDGRDALRGGQEADVLYGGEADDRLWGGSGDDSLRGGDGDDEIRGGKGDDRFHGGSGDDRLVGGEGDDRVRGGAGDDTMIGRNGEDRLKGRNGDDLLLGGKGDDRLRGGNAEDVLKGGDGDDLLHGGRGDDRLRGGDGEDLLRGGSGTDDLVGGADADSFILKLGDGASHWRDADRIRDFEDGIDLIGLAGELTYNDLSIHARRGAAVVRDDGEILAIVDGAAGQLTAADFFEL